MMWCSRVEFYNSVRRIYLSDGLFRCCFYSHPPTLELLGEASYAFLMEAGAQLLKGAAVWVETRHF